MRRFKFTLDSVFIVREKALNDARIQLASVMDLFNKQKDILQKMKFELIRIEKESARYLEEGEFNPTIISNYTSFSFKLTQDIKAQERLIEETKKKVTKCQEIAKEAYIKVKTLENLKEKQKEEYNKEFLREEFKEADDITNSRRVEFAI